MQRPRIEYFVRTEGERPHPRQREDGRVDFYDLNLIENVVVGQVLARIPPDEEADPQAFPAGENVYVPEDNPRVLVAAVNGHAYWKDGLLHVSPEYVIDGDVDFCTGNVVFVGRLIVKGTIRAGFSVEARELVVEGEVEGEVHTAGQMAVKGGIVGGEKGRVRCGGDLEAMYILNAHVEVEGDLRVEKSIRNSTVAVLGKVEVWGEPGVILGGKVKAGGSIKARWIGAKWGTPTEVSAGRDPFLEAEIEALKAKEGEVEDPEELEGLQNKIALLEAKLNSEGQGAEVEVSEGIYHGVEVAIRGVSENITEDLQGPKVLRLQGGEIRIG